MTTENNTGGFDGDPSEALNPPADGGGCCGSTAPADTDATGSCCGTTALADTDATDSCCGSSAPAETAAAGTGCC